VKNSGFTWGSAVTLWWYAEKII